MAIWVGGVTLWTRFYCRAEVKGFFQMWLNLLNQKGDQPGSAGLDQVNSFQKKKSRDRRGDWKQQRLFSLLPSRKQAAVKATDREIRSVCTGEALRCRSSPSPASWGEQSPARQLISAWWDPGQRTHEGGPGILTCRNWTNKKWALYHQTCGDLLRSKEKESHISRQSAGTGIADSISQTKTSGIGISDSFYPGSIYSFFVALMLF